MVNFAPMALCVAYASCSAIFLDIEYQIPGPLGLERAHGTSAAYPHSTTQGDPTRPDATQLEPNRLTSSPSRPGRRTARRKGANRTLCT
jgi:hypothetical protein